MRKTFALFLIFFLAAFGLTACSSSNNIGGGHNNQPGISVSPTTTSLFVGQSTTLTANVRNLSDTHVTWTLQESNGGLLTITNTGTVYTAPWPVGTYHVTATSVADPSLSATATLSVSAAFAFLEEYPAGAALPYSMTPRVGTYGPDGTFTITGYVDSITGNPISVAMEAVALSSDGVKSVFDVETPYSTYSTWDIYTANVDATGNMVQLTTDGNSWYPEFSFDGQQIVYIHADDIWKMNANGTNQQTVFSGALNSGYAHSATFSPDATQIAGELEWSPGGVYHDGIAIMNADGSNIFQLTGGSDFPCAIGWDEAPAFTHDGTQIMFSRYCNDDQTESLYVINTDGTGLTAMTTAVPGFADYNPIPVGDKIVFQTNQDYPFTNSYEIYGMNQDGTSMTRLTENTIYDGFDTLFYSVPSAASAQFAKSQSAARSSTHGMAKRVQRIKSQQLKHLR